MSGWSVIASSNSISSGNLDITGLDLSSYKAVRAIITGVTVVTDGTSVIMQLYLAGSLFTASNYRYMFVERQPGVGGSSRAGSVDPVMWISPWVYGMSNNAACSFLSDILIHDPSGSGLRRAINYRTSFTTGTTHFAWVRGVASVDSVDAITGFRVKTFSGSGLATGRLTLHGLT